MRLAHRLLLISVLIVLMAGVLPAGKVHAFLSDIRVEEFNVQTLNSTSYIQPGEVFRTAVILKNNGYLEAEMIRLKYYLSWDELYSANDRYIDMRQIEMIPAGAGNVFEFYVSMPADAPSGQLYLIVIADADGDQNKGNNIKARAVQVYTAELFNRPDLVVTDLHGTRYTSKNHFILLDVTVKNTGNTAIQFNRRPGNHPDSRLENLAGFYLKNPTTGEFYMIYSQTFREYYLPDIQPGETNTFLYKVYIYSSYPAGNGYVFIRSDPNNYLPEKIENNNMGSYMITILPDNQTAPVDLTLRSLAMPSAVNLGSGFNVTGTLANNGADTSGPFFMSYYLSLDNIIDQSDRLIDRLYYDNIPARGTVSFSRPGNLPSGIAPGTYYLIGKADIDDNVVETDEQNNLYVIGPITITARPDLFMDYLGGPGTARAGNNITVESTVRNGGSIAAGSFTIKYYLSHDQTITSSDTLIGQRQVSGLDANSMETRTTSVRLPPGLSPAIYYIGAIVDSANSVSEGREDNNLCTDLLAIRITVPQSGGNYK